MFPLTVAEQDQAEAVAEPNGELIADDQTQRTIFEISLKDERCVVAANPQWVERVFSLMSQFRHLIESVPAFELIVHSFIN